MAAPGDVVEPGALASPRVGERRAPGIRARIAIAVVTLVAVTAIVLGVGAVAFVDASLRDQLRASALRQADYDLGTLIPTALPGRIDRASLNASGLLETFRLRGDVETIVDFGDGDPVVSSFDLVGALAGFPPELRPIVDGGQIAYLWASVAGRASLVLAGHPAAGQPAFYFVHDASDIDGAIAQLRIALLVGSLLLIALALAAARTVARGILRPIVAASRAAGQIADGQLDARVVAASGDEFGRWAAEFNRMAGTLETTIERLRSAEARNRRFVADVAHELRTPLTGLVAEASLLRGELGALPPDVRRAVELLVADVARLRSLVEDLLEMSRFDASAERLETEPVDLGRRLAALVASRLPAATLALPDEPCVIETDPRRFDRIVGNLLDNARVHAPGAPVSVSLTRDPDGVRVAVADRGPGVGAPGLSGPARGPGGPVMDLEQLFERFAKADPARPGGSGLGLAIAREHAELLGGSLRATAGPG
ncbi:MAG TPA: HAMP domain-containing sensor histidine kinase, partial [Candidatus Limnocylindrales bacterium]